MAAERQALHQALSALQQAVEQVSALNKQILQEAEEQLLDLAVGIAGKVLQHRGYHNDDPPVLCRRVLSRFLARNGLSRPMEVRP